MRNFDQTSGYGKEQSDFLNPRNHVGRPFVITAITTGDKTVQGRVVQQANVDFYWQDDATETIQKFETISAPMFRQLSGVRKSELPFLVMFDENTHGRTYTNKQGLEEFPIILVPVPDDMISRKK